MNAGDASFLEGLFRRYYFDHFDMIRAPERAPEREFGYQRLGSGMVRHLAVAGDRELRLLLAENVPSDVYCSNAYYAFPSMPMREKEWRGADLIFDIDAKDLGLPCREGHTLHVCGGCAGVSEAGGGCARCGSARSAARSLPCRKCIDASRREAGKLREILVDDLGVDGGGIEVYFSGNEGFHVHARDAGLREVGSKGRAELADYVAFRGAVPESVGLGRPGRGRPGLADMGERGWRGRFARDAFGSKAARARAAAQARKDPGARAGAEMLAASAGRIGARIDPNVTTDIHRIFRLPGSLNSKSGLSKIRDDGSDPYAAAALLGDEPAEVVAECPARFSLGGRRFGPFGGRAAVPAYAAAYMICKGLAAAARPVRH